MNVFIDIALIALIALAAPGVWRSMRGPGNANRILGMQLVGTVAIAAVSVRALHGTAAGLADVVLVFAVLTAITAIAFVRRLWIVNPDSDGGRHVVE